MKVFLVILIILLQLADSLEKQDPEHHDHSHALQRLGAVTVLTTLQISTSFSKTENKQDASP